MKIVQTCELKVFIWINIMNIILLIIELMSKSINKQIYEHHMLIWDEFVLLISFQHRE